MPLTSSPLIPGTSPLPNPGQQPPNERALRLGAMLTLLVLCGTKTVWIRSERRVATTGRFAVPSQRISQKPKPTETVPRQFQPELSLEKSQISLATLIMALFYDLATEKDFKIPTQPERRERALRDLIKKRQRPIALFIDDAHDLHSKTLIGLKRLIEVVRDSGRHSFGSAGRPSEAEKRSTPAIHGRNRFPSHDIRIGGVGQREEKVS